MSLVARFDLVRFSPQTTLTPQGFLQAPAHFTCAGVFEYIRADGTMIRELRPADEVFAPKSMATLKGCPVVIDHPRERWVTPSNFKKLAVGWSTDMGERADNKLAGSVIVSDKSAIDRVGTDLCEISMGYKCRIDKSPGVDPEFGPYDQIQRDIKYNHVALGPTGWGRAGEDVGLRLDADAAIMHVREDAATSLEHLVMQKADLADLRSRKALAEGAGIDLWVLHGILDGYEEPTDEQLRKIADAIKIDLSALKALVPREDRADGQPESKPMETEKITINGVEFEVPKSAAQAMRAEQGRADAQRSESEKLQGRFDAQDERLKKTEKDLAEALDSDRFDGAVIERIELLDRARKVLGVEAEISGSRREIMEAVLRHDKKDLDFSKRSEDYVESRFDALLESWKDKKESDPDESKRQARQDARSAQTGGDADPEVDRFDAKAAQARMREYHKGLSKAPLTVTNKPE